MYIFFWLLFFLFIIIQVFWSLFYFFFDKNRIKMMKTKKKLSGNMNRLVSFHLLFPIPTQANIPASFQFFLLSIMLVCCHNHHYHTRKKTTMMMMMKRRKNQLRYWNFHHHHENSVYKMYIGWCIMLMIWIILQYDSCFMVMMMILFKA